MVIGTKTVKYNPQPGVKTNKQKRKPIKGSGRREGYRVLSSDQIEKGYTLNEKMETNHTIITSAEQMKKGEDKTVLEVVI